jgi:hypothetical protein
MAAPDGWALPAAPLPRGCRGPVPPSSLGVTPLALRTAILGRYRQTEPTIGAEYHAVRILGLRQLIPLYCGFGWVGADRPNRNRLTLHRGQVRNDQSVLTMTRFDKGLEDCGQRGGLFGAKRLV